MFSIHVISYIFWTQRGEFKEELKIENVLKSWQERISVFMPCLRFNLNLMLHISSFWHLFLLKKRLKRCVDRKRFAHFLYEHETWIFFSYNFKKPQRVRIRRRFWQKRTTRRLAALVPQRKGGTVKMEESRRKRILPLSTWLLCSIHSLLFGSK